MPGQTPRKHRGSAGGECRFNGGPGNCPAKLGVGAALQQRPPLASMEGRAIARPNEIWRSTSTEAMAALQWRAGQLPGQTAQRRCAWWNRHRRWCFNGGPGNCPAKQMLPHRPSASGCSFNGGPGNCPSKPVWWPVSGVGYLVASMEGRAIARPNTVGPDGRARSLARLQWRAGQLPGQTRESRSRQCLYRCFNGGPGNCPAKPAACPIR